MRQRGFRATVRNVVIGHILVVGATAVAPLFKGCEHSPDALILPVELQLEAAVIGPRTERLPGRPSPTPPQPPPPEPEPPAPVPEPPPPPAPVPEPPQPAPPRPEVAPQPVAPPKPTRAPIERSTTKITRSATPPTPSQPRQRPPRPLTAGELRGLLGGGSSGGPGTPGATRNTITEDEATLARIQRLLHAAWIQPGTGAFKGMETRVVFRLLPDGRITGEQVDSSSGSSEVDASTLTAVRGVGRLDGLPADFALRFPSITVVFEVR